MRYIFRSYYIGVFIAVLIVCIGYYGMIRPTILRTHHTYAWATLASVIATYETHMPPTVPFDMSAPQSIADVVHTATYMRVGVYTLDGDTVAFAPSDRQERVDRATLHAFATRVYTQVSATSRPYELGNDSHGAYAIIPVVHEGKMRAIGVLRLPEDAAASLVRAMDNALLLLVGLAGLIGCGITYCIVRQRRHDLRFFSTVLQRWAAGERRGPLTTHISDEYTPLKDAYNAAYTASQRRLDTVSHKVDAAYTIIRHLAEGVLVLNNEGRVVLCNASMSRILDTDIREDAYYWEVVRHPEIQTLLEKVFVEHVRVEEQFQHGERHMQMTGEYISPISHAVFTVYDVTEFVAITRIKQDLVSNVSHELRTPLSSIHGFVETLREDASPSADHYLEIIQRNTERLIAIVSDLLTLSELERPSRALVYDTVDIGELVRDVARTFSHKAAQKGIELCCDIPADLPAITADAFALQQVCTNIIDNACKYTEKGSVSIAVAPQDTGVVITVKDTGIGIPREDINRIFERFYVVDKSRSRRVGGTGLGLSIVKHCVQQHGGRIELTSKVGEGTTCTITIPGTPPLR